MPVTETNSMVAVFFCKKKGHMKKDCRAWLKKKSEQANVTSESANHDEVSLIMMDQGPPSPVRNLVLRSFPNASEDKIINWEKASKDENFKLFSCGALKEVDNGDMELIAEGTESTGACCCSRSKNFYNILCCRKNDDQADHETDNDDDQVEIHVVEHENNQETDIEADAEELEELNLGAWDLGASSVEDAFYHMAFGDDEYEVSSDEEEHLDNASHDGKPVENVVAETMSEPSDNTRDKNVELNEEQRDREQRLRIALANDGMRDKKSKLETDSKTRGSMKKKSMHELMHID